MVEKTEREKVPSGRRAPEGREWEVLIRAAASEPFRHVGSVRAVSPNDAHESASRLFGWYATDIWVVPADVVNRYAAASLSDEREPATPSTGEETRTTEL